MIFYLLFCYIQNHWQLCSRRICFCTFCTFPPNRFHTWKIRYERHLSIISVTDTTGENLKYNFESADILSTEMKRESQFADVFIYLLSNCGLQDWKRKW